MKDQVGELLGGIWRFLGDAATHPIVYGSGAAIARWLLGDRAGGIGALLTYISSALLVAFGTTLYLSDEGLPANRSLFFAVLLAFIARDVLVALLSIAVALRDDPIGGWIRLRDALRGRAPQQGDDKP